MRPGDPAARVVRAWARAYTAGLAPTPREARRAEIESDLWEHREAGGSATAILGRCARGMAADIAWRRGARRPRRWTRRHVGHAALHIAGLASFGGLAVQHGVLATRLAGLHDYGADWEPADLAFATSFGTAVLAVLLLGAALLWRRPRTGVACLLAAAIATSAAMWWALPLLAPMTLALAASSVSVARRRRRALGG